MKGISGVIVAIGLGIAGALANFYYLHSEAQKVDTVSFIGLRKAVIIGRGERLLEDKLVEVKIPRTTWATWKTTPTNGMKWWASAMNRSGGRWTAGKTRLCCSAAI